MERQSADSGARAVFLVDGWTSFRRSLRLFLEAAGYRIAGEADNADHALETREVRDADVILLDPGPDASDLERDLTSLRRAAPAAGIVLLGSEPVAAPLVLRGVERGVSAYLTKRDGPADLLRAIEAALTRDFVMLPRRLVSRRWVPSAQTPHPLDNSPVPRPLLTRREHEILALAATSRSNRDIAEILYVSPQTVVFHLANTYRKLGVTSRAQAIGAARSLGLLGWEDGRAA
jgi:two-component system, NarL family, response regulator